MRGIMLSPVKQLPAHVERIVKRARRTLVVAAAAALVAGSVWLGQGSTVSARSVEDITGDINRLSQQQSSLDAKIIELERQIQAKHSEIRSLNNDVALLQQEVDALQLQVENTQTKIEKTNAQIEKTTIEIRATEERIGGAKLQLAALIRLMAQLDETNPFEVLIANRSFSELLDQVQYTERIQQDTQARLDEVQQLRAELDVQKHNLEVALRDAQQLKTSLEGQQQGLVVKKAEKADLLDKTKGEEASYQDLLDDTEALRKQVQDDINALQRELGGSAGGVAPPLGSGIFLPPCNCQITQGFGMSDYAKNGAYGGAPHEGIDFAGPMGSPAFAAADGTVLAKGALGAAAYGNWIMLWHAQYNVATLYGHLISMPSIAVGATVEQGDVIANVGSTGYSSGPHVHFGVGVNPQTVSKPYGLLPIAQWVDPSSYLAL